MVSYAVCYGEFQYQAGSWEYPRRVVCKVEKPAEQLIHMYTFIVTNMDSESEKVIRFYCKRGIMENYIKESKNGFDFAAVSSSSKTVMQTVSRFMHWHTTYLIGLNVWLYLHL